MKKTFESFAEFKSYLKTLQLDEIEDIAYLLFLRDTCQSAPEYEMSQKDEAFFLDYVDLVDKRLKKLNVILITEDNFDECIAFLRNHIPAEKIAEMLLNQEIMDDLSDVGLSKIYRFCMESDFDETDPESKLTQLFDLVCDEKYHRQKDLTGICLN